MQPHWLCSGTLSTLFDEVQHEALSWLKCQAIPSFLRFISTVPMEKIPALLTPLCPAPIGKTGRAGPVGVLPSPVFGVRAGSHHLTSVRGRQE